MSTRVLQCLHSLVLRVCELCETRRRRDERSGDVGRRSVTCCGARRRVAQVEMHDRARFSLPHTDHLQSNETRKHYHQQ